MEIIKYNYWFRTTLGLEKIVLDELRERIEISSYEIKQRSLFVEISKPIENKKLFFKDIRTADDVYTFVGSYNKVDNTKPSTDGLTEYFKKNILPIIKKYPSKYFRITVSFVGERNFSRFFVENKINDLVGSQTKFKVLSSENEDPREPGELRVRCHIEDKTAYFGISIFDTPLHRRSWRVDNYDGQLHPPVAAAMARLIQPKRDIEQIIDPFCGSGTVLIESALLNTGIGHIGYDINAEAVALTKKRAGLSGVEVTVNNKDAFDSQLSYINKIVISNPPWDNKFEIKDSKVFIENLRKIILASKQTILIIPENFIEVLRNNGLPFIEVIKTRVNGKIVVICTLNNN